MVLLIPLYNPLLVVLSVVIAIFASYVALDLASTVTKASGRQQTLWLAFGALAMGFGIWSMHFVGMLAVNLQGVPMAYDIPLMALSIIIAILASALALFIVSRPAVPTASLVAGGVAMAAAIAGMHYTGMYSMRMPARIQWNLFLVTLSVLIALIASFAALLIAIRLKRARHRTLQISASIVMGIAISGMHYTGMAAATFILTGATTSETNVLQTPGLAGAVVAVTAVILGLAFAGSVVDRAFAGRKKRYLDAEKAILDLRTERELRDRFVSTLAHDLRTPLSAAQMSAQLARKQIQQPEKLERLFGKIIDNLGRMDGMLDDLLDAHRISAGRPLILQRDDQEAFPFLKEILDDLATVYGDRFVLDCPREGRGNWDPKYLRRALENLCTNAVKYGSEVAKITVRATPVGSSWKFSVHNKGAPIHPHEQEDLFGLFHRGHSAEDAGKRGWGLGLMIVKGIAEAHGGSVRVESSAEAGTTFSIEFPAELARSMRIV